jgi:hypothetical protein
MAAYRPASSDACGGISDTNIGVAARPCYSTLAEAPSPSHEGVDSLLLRYGYDSVVDRSALQPMMAGADEPASHPRLSVVGRVVAQVMLPKVMAYLVSAAAHLTTLTYANRPS